MACSFGQQSRSDSIDDAMNAEHDRASGSHAPAFGFDVLSDVLRCVRLTGSMLFLVDAHAPWMSWSPKTEAFRRVVLPGVAAPGLVPHRHVEQVLGRAA